MPTINDNGLAALKAQFKRYYYFSDEDVIDLVLGIVAGNLFDSDPVWLHLVSPPSSGKTELLFSLHECPEPYYIGDFTAATLISGYRDPRKLKGVESLLDDAGNLVLPDEEDYSLLPKLNGRVAITKDFSVISSKPSETRAQIFAILRDVYDGFASRGFGSSAVKSYHSRFNYITGMTPDIEKDWSLNTLGERFLMYRINIADRREHARRALLNARDGEKGALGVRKDLQAAVKVFVEGVKRARPKVSDGMADLILDLADVLTICRTYVHREKNSNELSGMPMPELSSRVGKQLMRIGWSVACVRGKSDVGLADLRVMKRVALDSLPFNRQLVLAHLWENRNKPVPISFLMCGCVKIGEQTVRKETENLAMLGAVDKETLRSSAHGGSNKVYYSLSERIRGCCERVGGVSPVG